MYALLEGKCSLVTGAASGIGKEIVRRFAQEGSVVILADIDKEKCIEVKESLVQDGYHAYAYCCDVSNDLNVRALFHQIKKDIGKVDIVVSNAGVDQVKAIHETSFEDWQKVIDINLSGLFLTNKYAIEAFLDEGKGVIVNISSIIGLVGQKSITSYAASKGGVSNLTRSLAVTYAEHNIRINAVCPGYVDTPLLKMLTPEMREERIKKHPMKRMGKAKEIADACIFLASDLSSFITGVNLPVDGGYTAQ
ncbi:SDR family NAD(P)-dependent oxidoreductase [Oceanobacillus sp. CFH 90083]|uniref:SDR family NAD(P)-dependent oxidoreductase n=1 Tax=Oceanobacillus sp. CFH 90083 TaxID=2592336 RepID=UPI00128CB6BD|nr:SDR family NAD(P)-dependent oxidoreductase [Oceanobacillus sp. CFH 90083]